MRNIVPTNWLNNPTPRPMKNSNSIKVLIFAINCPTSWLGLSVNNLYAPI
ncbi:hypothetical protein NWQ33_04320 [Mycoplasmopsis cynos]|nr:hypothetical protein [Mycoplasmopsis cynos]